MVPRPESLIQSGLDVTAKFVVKSRSIPSNLKVKYGSLSLNVILDLSESMLKETSF